MKYYIRKERIDCSYRLYDFFTGLFLGFVVAMFVVPDGLISDFSKFELIGMATVFVVCIIGVMLVVWALRIFLEYLVSPKYIEIGKKKNPLQKEDKE